MQPFFRTIDWQLLYDKKIEPPYNPNVVSVWCYIGDLILIFVRGKPY